MAKRDEEDDGPAGAPEWIVTFADMTSLLVTFFVMLMTFSTMEELELMLIQGVKLIGRGGMSDPEKGPTPYDPSSYDIASATNPRDGAPIPHSRPEWELEDAEEDEMGQRRDPDQLELDLRSIADGLQITFPADAGFAPGSAEVTPALRARLVEIAEVLSHYPHLVVVEGFTDDRFQPTPQTPTAEAMALARAAAAADVLLRTALAPERLQIAGLGARRFLADNETALNRGLNRRVELRVLATVPGDPRRGDYPVDDSDTGRR